MGRRMQAVGLGWDAAQLVGRAAPLAGDRRATAGLHAAARTLDSASDPGPVAAHGDETAGRRSWTTSPPFPCRRVRSATGTCRTSPSASRRSAGSILAGLTYKQIGAQLYISAKTVEHHVARMRQRLGVGSRGELLAQPPGAAGRASH